jgi:hypothetical protein
MSAAVERILAPRTVRTVSPASSHCAAAAAAATMSVTQSFTRASRW